MRLNAKKQGFTLNQYGLTEIKSGNLLTFGTENDIFTFLGMDYVEPHNR